MNSRSRQRWVVKVGSALLSDPVSGLNKTIIKALAKDVANLQASGFDVVLVSSGAIADGIQRLSWRERPNEVHKLQAAAAIGQMGLVEAYQSAFQEHNIQTAQILLTDADIVDRVRYLNARGTFRTLLDLRVVPIVNENDTVVTEEIRFGDNDTLAAMVSNLIDAQYLVILTDQEGLFDQDPRLHDDALLIREDIAGNPRLEAFAGKSGIQGRGGMITKLDAASRAARSGTSTFIVSGQHPQALQSIRDGHHHGTLLRAQNGRVAAKKQWLAGQLHVSGHIYLDSGAVDVLQRCGSSLLSVGVIRIDGKFRRGELVGCIDVRNDAEIARGLVNYSSDETALIMGKPSTEIQAMLGYTAEPELIHRDNIVILQIE
ncbi:MAG: glutamate 5-kinase [Acidiferrobacteraceae bacterium]|nr:glutamate 5-kinase [Acidiferrobacteraceae bacterium]